MTKKIVQIIIVIICILFVVFLQKKMAYSEFLLFKESEENIPRLITIEKIVLDFNESQRGLILSITGKDKQDYKVKLSSVSKEQVDLLEKLNFKDTQIMFFMFKKQRCLVGIFKESTMIIQGETKADALAPFSLFKKCSFQCDSV